VIYIGLFFLLADKKEKRQWNGHWNRPRTSNFA